MCELAMSAGYGAKQQQSLARFLYAPRLAGHGSHQPWPPPSPAPPAPPSPAPPGSPLSDPALLDRLAFKVFVLLSFLFLRLLLQQCSLYDGVGGLVSWPVWIHEAPSVLQKLQAMPQTRGWAGWGGGDQIGDGRLIQAMAMPQDDYLDSQKSLGEHSESERRPYAPSYSFQLS